MTARVLPVAAPALIGRRAAACAVDVLVAWAAGVVCAAAAVAVGLGWGAAADGRALTLVFVAAAGAAWVGALAWWLVCTAMQGGAGSLGQRAFDVRLADEATGAPVGFGRALGRNLVWALSCLIYVGWFTPLFDAGPRRQGWHDRAARVVVVVDERATDAAPAVLPSAPALARVEEPAHTPAPRSAPAPAPAILLEPAPTGRSPWSPPLPPPTFKPPAARVAAASVPPLADRARIGARDHARSSSALARHVEARRDATITVPPPARRAALFADPPVLAVLTWDDGSRMAVYGRTLYGRNPAVESGIVSVPVRDETLSLSKTHFEIGGDASGAWIADRHSTNGTVLVRDGGRHPLVAGRPTALRPGDQLELGDRTATVGVGS